MTTFATNQDLSETALREVFGAFPSGVVAVVADIDGVPVGLAASSFTSVSIDPPLVSISIANGSKTWPDLRRADHLGVTVLAGHHAEFARQLAGPVQHRFDDIPLSRSETSAIHVRDGVAHFETTIHSELPAGDHTIVLLQVRSRSVLASAEPLLFHRSGFRQISA
jgi:flavin reductase (DIM6/NTAB) family NADH-FMN oxidoreductase RutF